MSLAVKEAKPVTVVLIPDNTDGPYQHIHLRHSCDSLFYLLPVSRSNLIAISSVHYCRLKSSLDLKRVTEQLHVPNIDYYIAKNLYYSLLLFAEAIQNRQEPICPGKYP
jgi:hypothetical protein